MIMRENFKMLLTALSFINFPHNLWAIRNILHIHVFYNGVTIEVDNNCIAFCLGIIMYLVKICNF